MTSQTHAAWQFLNSNFSAALFGALAGALCAHFIATRSEKKRRLLDEMAGVNNAIELTNAITNTFLAIKRQHVRPLSEMYRKSFAKYVDVFNRVHPPPPAPATVYHFFADFRSFPMPLTPIVELRQTILNRIPSSTRAISISVPLHQCINSLDSILSMRNETIEALRKYSDPERIDAYFGLRHPSGSIDESYPDLILGLSNNTDDAIYFSMLLSELLIAHGNRLSKRYGRNAPKISKLDYSNVPTDLLPGHSNYADYEKQFRAPPKLQTRREIFVTRIKNLIDKLA